MNIIGLDIGTTNISAAILDPITGDVLHTYTIANESFLKMEHVWERIQDPEMIINAARGLLDEMLAPGGMAIVDPAMADHGKLYSGFDSGYAKAMQKLCEKADIMIPNITEAAMMAGMEYLEEFDMEYIDDLLDKLPGKDVVLTGVGFYPRRTGAAVRRDGEVTFFETPKVGESYSGTGDMFAACFAGALMQDKTMEEAASIACRFVLRAIEATEENPAHWYGVKFETALPWLINQLF